jgi:hypothetical protein
MRWGTKLRWLKPLNGRWNRNRHPSLEYRTTPNLRPANRKNPASIFSVKFNWLYDVMTNLITWNRFRLNILKSILSSFVNGPASSFVIFKFQILSQFQIWCRFNSIKTCSHPRQIRRCNPIFHRSADPCGSIRRPCTARIRLLCCNWLQKNFQLKNKM